MTKVTFELEEVGHGDFLVQDIETDSELTERESLYLQELLYAREGEDGLEARDWRK